MNMGKYILLLFFAVVMASCLSGPVDIGGELTAAELVQRAQEASDRNRYKISLQYYEAILERFPQDMEYVCAAEYETAFIHYKQKKYDESREEFTSLLARYDNNPDEELLPQQYKILSRKILDTITEIENRRSKTGPTGEE
jgi:outer membrane protein assembly factor BamD (BamD/ComL family)